MRAISSLIAGVDEVGKGALFGPVFAGAVILSKENELISNDSQEVNEDPRRKRRRSSASS